MDYLFIYLFLTWSQIWRKPWTVNANVIKWPLLNTWRTILRSRLLYHINMRVKAVDSGFISTQFWVKGNLKIQAKAEDWGPEETKTMMRAVSLSVSTNETHSVKGVVIYAGLSSEFDGKTTTRCPNCWFKIKANINGYIRMCIWPLLYLIPSAIKYLIFQCTF